MIHTDGVYVTSDTSLAELGDFAKLIGMDKSQLRINRWAIYYEYRDARQREMGRCAGARPVSNRNEVWAKWQSRAGAEPHTLPPPLPTHLPTR